MTPIRMCAISRTSFPCSALKGENTDEIIRVIMKYLPEGPQFFDADTITDQPERQIVAELIREKALRLLDEEIPHGIAVVIERMKERQGPQSPMMDIDATIICETGFPQGDHYREKRQHAEKDRQPGPSGD